MDIQYGFTLIDRKNCQFYKDGKDFIHKAVNEYLLLNTKAGNNIVDHKVALIIGHTGLIFILLSILRASIPNDKHKDYAIYNHKFSVHDKKIRFTNNRKTIDPGELLTRLEGCKYELGDVKNIIRDLSEIRNDIIHHFNLKPQEELLTSITSIFFVVKKIIPDAKEFWGDKWDELCSIDAVAKGLNIICQSSYQKHKFQPDPYYFKCSRCSSTFIAIEEDEQSMLFFQCKQCNLCKYKDNLIEDLANSDSYKETHQIISFLNLYKNVITDEEQNRIHDATENPQVGDILGDNDINQFYCEIFGDEYFTES